MTAQNTIHIRNMVCRRCVDTVNESARRLELPVLDIQMGYACFATTLSPEQLTSFKTELEKHGFEILTTRQAKTVERIKLLIQERIRDPETEDSRKLSAHLSDTLHYEYSHLSKLFSASEGITIERYFALQRLERTKELLAYNELTITQIAEEVGFSNAAHLASSFKKETGMRPSEFRKQTTSSRKIP